MSGHSSGGILAAYVAGVIPELVKGVMLEDPPFFNVMPGEFENTFVFHDGFKVTHEFLKQTEEYRQWIHIQLFGDKIFRKRMGTSACNGGKREA